MGYNTKPKIIKVELPSDSSYWAKVKSFLPYGELKGYVEYGGSEGFLTTSEKLRLSIVEWNLDNDAGEVLPITVENIDLLQEDDVLAISDAATPSSRTKKKKT